MTVPRLPLVVGIAVVFYLLGNRAGRGKYTRLRRKTLRAWNHPEVRKGRARLQKLARRNYKKINKAMHLR